MQFAGLEANLRLKQERGCPSRHGTWERERNASIAAYSEGKYDYDLDEQHRRSGPEGARWNRIEIREDHFELGHRVWDTCILMSKFFEAHPDLVRGRRVVEVGAGTGLLGLVLSRIGAQAVTMTEYGPCMGHLELNMELNRSDAACAVSSCTVDWNEEALPGELVQEPCDLVLAADITVFPDTFPMIVDLLRRLTALRPDAELIMGCQQRREAHASFVEMASAVFAMEEIPTDEWHPDYRTDRHVLYRMRLRA